MDDLDLPHYTNRKLLDLCRDVPCMMRIPGVCLGREDTVVPAHDNNLNAGKGMSIKADDCFAIPACFNCHDEYDGRTHTAALSKQDRQWYFDKGLRRWLKYLWSHNLIQVRR